MIAGGEALGTKHLALAGLDGRITVLSREDGSQTAFYDTDGSLASRHEFFKDDGNLDYTGVRSLEARQINHTRSTRGTSICSDEESQQSSDYPDTCV